MRNLKFPRSADIFLVLSLFFLVWGDYGSTWGLSLLPVFLSLFFLPFQKISRYELLWILFLFLLLPDLHMGSARLFFHLLTLLIFYRVGQTVGLNRRYAFWVILTGIVSVLYAIYQLQYGYAYLNKLLESSPSLFSENIIARLRQSRAQSFFVLPSLFSQFLLFQMLLVHLARFPSSFRLRFLLQIVFLVGIFLSKSFLGMGLGVVILFFSLERFISRKSLLFGLSLLLIAGAGIVFSARWDSFWGPNNPLLRRIDNWNVALKMFTDFFHSGVGLAQFEHHYLFYAPRGSNITTYAHNLYLQMFSEVGFYRGVFFLVILLIPLLRLKEKKSFLLFWGVFLITQFFDLGFYYLSVGGLFFFLLGTQMPSKKHTSSQSLARWGGAGLFILALVGDGVIVRLDQAVQQLENRADWVKYFSFLDRKPVLYIYLAQLQSDDELRLKFLNNYQGYGFYREVKEQLEREIALKRRDRDLYFKSLKISERLHWPGGTNVFR